MLVVSVCGVYCRLDIVGNEVLKYPRLYSNSAERVVICCDRIRKRLEERRGIARVCVSQFSKLLPSVGAARVSELHTEVDDPRPGLRRISAITN